MRAMPSPSRTRIAGRKRITGTEGCTRESLSRRSDSNILGEAFSTSVRRSVVVVFMALSLSIGLAVPPTDGARTMRHMWNPLSLPVAVLGTAADVLRALTALPAALAALEERLVQLDRLAEQGEVIRQLLEQTKAAADRIGQFAEPILQASVAASQQLERTQQELAEVNSRLERMLAEASEPAD